MYEKSSQSIPELYDEFLRVTGKIVLQVCQNAIEDFNKIWLQFPIRFRKGGQ